MKGKLISYADSFKEDPLKFIRDNLSVIIFIPTILGGFWQIIQLSDISLSYIRFFSLTQIIPDGLTVLIILLLMSVMGLFFVIIFQKIVVDFLELNDNLDVPINKRFNIVSKVIISIFSLLFTYIIFFIHFDQIIHFFIGVLLMLLILIFFVFFNVMFLRGIKLMFFKKIDVPRLADITFMKLRFIYILPFGFYSLLFIIALTKNFRIPRNLVNFERIETLDTTKSVARRVLYYNDKYVFLEEFDLNKFEKTKKFNLKNRVIKIETLINDNFENYNIDPQFKLRELKAFNTIDSVNYHKQIFSDDNPSPQKSN